MNTNFAECFYNTTPKAKSNAKYCIGVSPAKNKLQILGSCNWKKLNGGERQRSHAHYNHSNPSLCAPPTRLLDQLNCISTTSSYFKMPSNVSALEEKVAKNTEGSSSNSCPSSPGMPTGRTQGGLHIISVKHQYTKKKTIKAEVNKISHTKAKMSSGLFKQSEAIIVCWTSSGRQFQS